MKKVFKIGENAIISTNLGWSFSKNEYSMFGLSFAFNKYKIQSGLSRRPDKDWHVHNLKYMEEAIDSNFSNVTQVDVMFSLIFVSLHVAVCMNNASVNNGLSRKKREEAIRAFYSKGAEQF